LDASVRPKSDAVKAVTLSARPSASVALWNAVRASLTRPSNVGCWAIRLSCRSNPPIDTKKTCRVAPSALRAAISRATILSWSASGLLVGKVLNGALVAG
jgi:hypothetical protein